MLHRKRKGAKDSCRSLSRESRQVFQGIGMLAPALALCAAATSAQSAQDATVLLTCGLGASALTLAGVSVSGNRGAVVFACCLRLHQVHVNPYRGTA